MYKKDSNSLLLLLTFFYTAGWFWNFGYWDILNIRIAFRFLCRRSLIVVDNSLVFFLRELCDDILKIFVISVQNIINNVQNSLSHYKIQSYKSKGGYYFSLVLDLPILYL